MANQRFIGLVFALAISAGAVLQSAHAAMVYEATRLDYQTGKHDLDVKMLVGERDVRVDVLAGGQAWVSLIESRDRLVVIDHVAGRYIAHAVSHADTALAPLPSAWASPSRRQFVLGGYCRVIEARWSEAVYQERCLVESGTILKGDRRPQIGTRAGEFLALVASTGDRAQLFDLTNKIMEQTTFAPVFPLLIRHFEQGQVRAEVRVMTVANSSLPRNIFDLPKGLHRIATVAGAATQASR